MWGVGQDNNEERKKKVFLETSEVSDPCAFFQCVFPEIIYMGNCWVRLNIPMCLEDSY